MSVERETHSTSAQFLLLDSATSSSSVHIITVIVSLGFMRC